MSSSRTISLYLSKDNNFTLEQFIEMSTQQDLPDEEQYQIVKDYKELKRHHKMLWMYRISIIVFIAIVSFSSLSSY